jgi:subtilisin family serine protease
MSDFPHLKLPFKVEGNSKSSGGGKRNLNSKAITVANKENRQEHGQNLKSSAESLVLQWEQIKAIKAKEEDIKLPNENDIPVFLKVDTEVFDIDTFGLWGINLISEEEDGYIIGASTDNLKQFNENVDAFLNESGIRKDKAAQIWQLITDENWRINKLLEEDLKEIWEEINPEKVYTVELGVSCYVPNTKKYPDKSKFDSVERFNEKVEEFKEHEQQIQIERDEKQIQRESEIEEYINTKSYNGELHQIWSNGEDAVHFKVSVNGKGLKDIVQTFQYLYEVKLISKYDLDGPQVSEEDYFEVEILPPNQDSVKVCVIDSGIQENHKLIEPALDSANSRSYIDEDASTADYVRESGHGTKVAGAVLYPQSIPKEGQFQLEHFVQNARILNAANCLPSNKFEPTLMEEIVSDYSNTRIFNLSVATNYSYSGTHMPAWAASLDKLIHDKDILFVVSAGNLYISSNWNRSLGVKEHIEAGREYPNYLDRSGAKIANPGVSYFALTVGSVAKEDFEDNDYKSLAGKDRVSPFSRTGLGMWNCIKPDVVEFGGDFAKNKLSTELITNEATSPELVNSTLYGASATGKDSCGTSFSAPKVSYIAAKLQAEHPDESAQIYRALIVQSARLPEHCFHNPTFNDFTYYGYGIPDVNRALNNSESRITFIQSGKVKPKMADIYRVEIPNDLRGEGKDFRILVEITLAFTAKTRMTRKKSHSYLSNWLEWKTSNYNEKFSSFRNRTIEYLENDDENTEIEWVDEAAEVIKWVIRENSAWAANGINRNNSTVQKSWAIIEPHQFAKEFSLAVIGHAGWDKNLESETSYALCVSFESLDSEMNIYELLAQAQVQVEQEVEIEL